MKFFNNRFREFDSCEGRYAFMADQKPNAEFNDSESENKKESSEKTPTERIKDVLSNPIRLSLSDVRFLEDNFEKITSADQAKFRDIVGYLLGQVKQGTAGSDVPRELHQISWARRLMGMLPETMQKTIEVLVSDDSKKLLEIGEKDEKNWSMADLARACFLYKKLRQKAVPKEGKLDSQFLKIKEKIIARSVPMLHRYQSSQTGEQVKKILDREGRSATLSNAEKLVLLEVYHMFPDSSDWGVEAHSVGWKNLAAGAIDELFQNENNPNFLLAWEILQDSLENENGRKTFAGVEISPEKFNRLTQLVTRGNAVRFLSYLKGRKNIVLLPSEWKTLKEILNQPEGFWPKNFSERDWQDATQSKKSADLEQELIQLKTKKKEIEDRELNRMIEDKSVTEKESVDYQKAVQQKSKVLTSIWGNQIQRISTDLLSQWMAFRKNAFLEKTRGKTAEERDSDWEKQYQSESEKVEKDIKEFVQKFEKEKLASLKSENERDEKVSEVQKFFSSLMRYGAIQEVPIIRDFLEEFGEYKNKKADFEQKEVSLKEKLPFSEPVRAELKSKEEEIKKLEQDQRKETQERQEYKDFNEFFTNPKAVTQDLLKNYESQINSRISSHKLHSADISVLFEKEKDVPPNIKNFRDKFKQVLDKVLSEIQLPPIGAEADKFVPLYQMLDEKLGHHNLLRELQAAGLDLRADFGSPQMLSQMLEGALFSFRDSVLEKIVPQIPVDHQAEFLAHWKRLHTRSGHEGELSADIDGAVNRYLDSKSNNAQKIESANQNLLAFIKRLEDEARKEQDPGKKKRLQEEAQKLGELVSLRANRYLHGGDSKDENGNPIWEPGKDTLNELSLQGEETNKKIIKVTERFQVEIDSLKKLAQGINALSGENRNLKKAELKQRLSSLQSVWPNSRQELLGHMSDLKGIFLSVMGKSHESIANTYFDAPKMVLNQIDRFFGDLTGMAQKNDYEFSGKELFWHDIPERFAWFNHFSDFSGGFWAGRSKRLDDSLASTDETLEKLQDKNFFEDSSSGKEDFVKKMNDTVTKFQNNYSDYKRVFENASAKVKSDIVKLSGDDIFKKYGFSKDYLKEVLSSHDSQINQFGKLSDQFAKPGFFKNWVSQYNESPESRLDALKDLSNWEKFEKAAGDALGLAKNWEEFLNDYSGWKKEKTVWKRSSFSLYDLYMVVKQCIDSQETLWKRDSDRAVAALGVQFFGHHNKWGKEFERRAEESEEKRVKEFEGQYHHEDIWKVREGMYSTNDKDEMRACINLLIKRGCMKWDDPSFWRALMKFQKIEVFNVPEDMNMSREKIAAKVGSACGYIWTREIHRAWSTSMAGQLKDAKGGFRSEFNHYENDPNARTTILGGMLQKWARGDSTGVDSARYEEFLFAAFENGKMNGQPDQRWYFLMKGISTVNPKTGAPLLSREALTRVNDAFLARFPHVDFIADKSSPKLNGRIVPPGTPGAEIRAWNWSDFKAWGEFLGDGNGSYDPRKEPAATQTERFFYQYVHMSGFARDRVNRMGRVSDKEGDHDDANSFFAEWTKNTLVEQLKQESSGRVKHTADFWRTYMSGFHSYMKYMNEYIQNGDVQWGTQDFWLKERKRILSEVGSRLHMALTATQTLQGNYNEAGSRESYIMGREDWEKVETPYSPSIMNAKNNVNKMMRNVFRYAGGGDRYDDVLDYMSSYEFGTGAWSSRKGNDWKDKNSRVEELIMNENINARFFQNESVIEKALKDYCG